MANTSVVQQTAEADCGHPTDSATGQAPSDTATGTDTGTPPLPQNAPDRMQVVRESLRRQGVSQPAAEIIIASWRGTTQKQYGTYFKRWLSLCGRGAIDPISPPVNEVLNYLTVLFHEGRGYSAINTARSALSAIITLQSGMTLGAHPLIKRFMRGVFTSRPALPRYNVTWDVSVMLTYLKSLSPVKKLPLMQLSHKLVALLALLTAQRGQSLHLVDIRNLTITKSHVKIRFGDLVKQSRPGHHLGELVIPGYAPDRRLCILKVLKEYMKRTGKLRKTATRLFITTIRPHKSVSRDTIARWMKTTMKNAGIDTSIFKPHSTRAASTSGARVPLATILKTAGWSTSCTFRKYYKKPVLDKDQFARDLLADQN